MKKAGFPGRQAESDENDEDIEDPSEEVTWKDIAPENDFNNYVACDDGVFTCAAEVMGIVNMSGPINSESAAEIDYEILIKTVTSCRALRVLETVKTYLMQQGTNYSIFSSPYKNQNQS